MKKIAAQIELYLLLATANRVYGPYDSHDGRKIVIVIDENGHRRTVSYPKFLLEQELGRQLDQDLETVDHVDTNKDNNDLSNLRIVPRQEHSGDDTRRVRLLDLICAQCNKQFQRSPKLVRDKAKAGKVGLFCSKECAGKYSRDVQLGLREKLPVPDPPASEYYKRKYEDGTIAAIANCLLSKYAGELTPNS